MNERYVHVFSSCGEEKEQYIYSSDQCVSTRNKHLYIIYTSFFFPFVFLSCKSGRFVRKGCPINKIYITHFF